jgi:hypothetical protein
MRGFSRKLQVSAVNQGGDMGQIAPRTHFRGIPATSDVPVVKGTPTRKTSVFPAVPLLAVVGAVALADDLLGPVGLMGRCPARVPARKSGFAGFRFPPDAIMIAVRWYLRYGLFYGISPPKS